MDEGGELFGTRVGLYIEWEWMGGERGGAMDGRGWQLGCPNGLIQLSRKGKEF